MKKIFLLRMFLFSLLFSIAISCSEEKEEAQIKVDALDIDIPNDSTVINVNVTSNVNWTSSLSTNSGFIVSPSAGTAGITQLSISAAPNITNAEKVADLMISGSGAYATIRLSQKSLIFSANPSSLLMDSVASTKTFEITTNTKWIIQGNNLPEWIESITPMSGNGNAQISITVKDNPVRMLQEYTLKIEYAGTWAPVIVSQKAARNNPPTKPSSLKPNTTDVSLIPIFNWTKSTDPDNDVIQYTVLYSVDGVNWDSRFAGENTTISLSSDNNILKPNTKYFYKVKADDGYAGGVTESDVVEFTTGLKDSYNDGSYTIYQQSTKVSPIKLVFTGDGYLPEHLRFGGLFDQNVNEAIEALFSIEPYKTYREYFTVYKVGAFSAETGVSNQMQGVVKNTAFSCRLTGGTGIQCDYDKVFSYAMKVSDMTQTDLVNTSVCVIINADIYAGTCYTISNGKSVAMVPVSREPGVTTTFGNIVCHEYGGHGFGRLADEYVNFNSAIPEDRKKNLLLWQGYGYFKNVSPYGTEAQVPWNRFFNKPDYSHVDIYQGGYLYAEGVTRSEYISCMVDNRLYFNTQCRYLIVERILRVAGEGELTYDKFYAKDVQKVPLGTRMAYDMKNFVPLAPPILIYQK